MPPRTRTRASKALKENIDVTANKLKPVKHTTKAPRKALSDKTNSASDDASLEFPTAKKTIIKKKTGPNNHGETKQNDEPKQKRTVKLIKNTEPSKDARPRRDRRLPERFVENTIQNNLSISKDSPNVALNSSTNPKAYNTPKKKESLSNGAEPEPSPFKTPAKVDSSFTSKGDSSLLANRPRRICRLPSRFEDHSISPNKYIPIQPANASTPIQQSKTKPVESLNDIENVDKKFSNNQEKRQVTLTRPTRLAKLNVMQKKIGDVSSDKSSPDSNNNAKGRTSKRKTTKFQASANKKSFPVKNAQSPIRKFLSSVSRFSSLANKTQSPIKKISPKPSANNKKINQNLSFKLLGSKKTSQETEHNDQDIYEFTFDPNEEPQPQKKKRKRTVTKKPTHIPAAKPKKVVYKSSYEQNISKALAALKSAVKPGQTIRAAKLTEIAEKSNEEEEIVAQNNIANNVNEVQKANVTQENDMGFNDTGKNSVHECNYPSIRVEDIAADIEPSMDYHDDINYSPVNSPRPNGCNTPNNHESVNHRVTPERSVQNNDPLNLLEDFSFDEQPVASSSMNMSARHPLASPWRVEFGSLPIKWPNNAYIKPNMTPAVETSFINPEDSINRKKHVYTNMLPQTNEMFTDNLDDTPNLKQTSIISFIKEMAEKSAKKKQKRSVSPSKDIYKNIVSVNGDTNKITKKGKENIPYSPPTNTSEEVLGSGNDTSTDKEERKIKKRKNDENICNLPAKSPRKKKDKDVTFFGFDESENQDENISPIKVNNNPIRGRSLRSRSKAVLREINGPTRAILPIAAKTKIATSSEAVNKVYEEVMSAADAPVFPEKNVENNVTNIENVDINDDSQSVHLFEDIDVVHHIKVIIVFFFFYFVFYRISILSGANSTSIQMAHFES